MKLKECQIKIIGIVILISLVSCNTSINVVKGDNNTIDSRQKIDSLQLIKNNIQPPKRWMK